MDKNQWRVIYYETKDGKCPVQEFIDSRSKKNQAKILSLISVLEEKGPNLPRPYADILTDGIHELRTKLSGEEGRTLYFFCHKKFIILTHTFLKHEDKVRSEEIERAGKIRKDFLSRFNEGDLLKLDEDSIEE